MRKKKILFSSGYLLSATGFGGFVYELMTYLYKTGKYELGLYATGMPYHHPDYERFPFFIRGTMPNEPHILEQLNRDQGVARLAYYGDVNINRVVQEFKPDTLIMCEDIWGVSYAFNKPFWNKINCVVSTTLDSLPLLPEAVDKANQVKHYFVWAKFAENEFKRLAKVEAEVLEKETKKFDELKISNPQAFEANQKAFSDFKKNIESRVEAFNRVKTLPGTINNIAFKRLSNFEREKLRAKYGIPSDLFCIGSLNRNQLRKHFPNLLEGYKDFLKNNPEIKNTKLLLFTSFSEGWNIPALITELQLSPDDVLCAYKCKVTGKMFIGPFRGENIDSPEGHKGSLATVGTHNPVDIEYVNEWYNLLDCFITPITSGGQERSPLEAKLTELVTMINAYSCGETICEPEACSLELDYSEYREIGTNFRKASVYPTSISKQIKNVYNMPVQKRRDMGRKARQWVLDNFSIEVIGKKYEELLDSLPEVDYDFKFDEEPKDPSAEISNEPNNQLWVKELYKKILKMDVAPDDSGLQYWTKFLENNQPRQSVVDFFRKTASEKNAGMQKQLDLADLLDNTGRKRMLICIKESIGDIFNATALFEDLKNKYPDHDFYVGTDPQYFDILDGNPYVHKCLPYLPAFESEVAMTGSGAAKGYFDAYLHLTVQSQRILNYLTR